MCCGRRGGTVTEAQGSPGAGRSRPGQPSSSTLFEYVGATALSIRGAVTGRVYHFDRSQRRTAVDPRDVSSLLAVPLLRRLSR